MKKLPVIIALLLLSACIYRFDPDVSKDSGRIVIEGDILIGDTTVVRVSRLQPLKAVSSEASPAYTAWVESSDGSSIYPYRTSKDTSFIDTTTPSATASYRLCVLTAEGVKYASSWQKVQPAPTIKKVSWAPTGNDLVLKVDMTAAAGSGCYRWDYEETWQYHAQFRPQFELNYETGMYIDHMNEPYWWQYYWCWKTRPSYEAGLAITKTLQGKALKDHAFLRIPLDDIRLQRMYRIKLKARAISEECYNYLHTLDETSDNAGSLTSPNPSELVGNIFNVDDPTDYAIGYIEAASIAEKTYHVNNTYYRGWLEGDDAELFAAEGPNIDITLNEFYDMGYRPVKMIADTVRWGQLRCIDCRLSGGTTTKPADWPTHDL